MPAPSPLAISTSSVQRLLKEEASYHKELAEQQSRADALAKKTGEDEDGNAEFLLKQQRAAVEQTRAVFAPLRARIDEAVAKLDDQIASATGAGHDGDLGRARDVLEEARKAEAARA
ncbi:hypothetical protein L249_6844 [Ophiocordyceps polyrhachis-furcata BCC 54312]|uniref:Tubulin-specific chaperone A n=1 Tax=Ophiocordyceps polyrhachis-furcata BCC 54312 TaxID=1330021 RepID=A0A367LKM4_9HYPO|nr:hypothetical protein L249_6844 [Ophiocordyceps polyrhachis-furcata BCC 54312]